MKDTVLVVNTPVDTVLQGLSGASCSGPEVVGGTHFFKDKIASFIPCGSSLNWRLFRLYCFPSLNSHTDFIVFSKWLLLFEEEAMINILCF